MLRFCSVAHALPARQAIQQVCGSEVNICSQAMLDESAETPSIEQLVNGSVATVAQMPAAAFSLADMLVSLCGQDSGKNKQQVFKGLVQHLTRHGSAQVHLSFLHAHHTPYITVCVNKRSILHNIKLCSSWSVELQMHYIFSQ